MASDGVRISNERISGKSSGSALAMTVLGRPPKRIAASKAALADPKQSVLSFGAARSRVTLTARTGELVKVGGSISSTDESRTHSRTVSSETARVVSLKDCISRVVDTFKVR